MFKFDFDVKDLDEGVESVFPAEDVGSSRATAANEGDAAEDVSKEISLADLVSVCTSRCPFDFDLNFTVGLQATSWDILFAYIYPAWLGWRDYAVAERPFRRQIAADLS